RIAWRKSFRACACRSARRIGIRFKWCDDCPLSLWERVRVRGRISVLKRNRRKPLTPALSQRERGKGVATQRKLPANRVGDLDATRLPEFCEGPQMQLGFAQRQIRQRQHAALKLRVVMR